MGQWITIGTARGPVQAWQSPPDGKSRGAAPKGGVVVVQEIFGVNAHIRSVADGFAAAGYLAIAPAFFDLVEQGVELDYGPAEFQRGRELVTEVGLDGALAVVEAAAKLAASAGKVATVGYCWGGTVVLRAAQELGLPGVSYYGARNVAFLDRPLKAPVVFHFGERDASIPPEAVQAHRDKLPPTLAQVFTYPAGHAFNRNVDPRHHDAGSAALAQQRTLEFLRKNIG
ncbi:dienelactone hydrolase family protein [Pseudoxanthomonas sangjuensis]|uniref:dienelactone hydrolase family protein n=1 Tax=Pseudoxanthomonas sangjuensis TaxID=1503750 RepID=UPI001390A2BC|nr:dienelactone hydrolase family protein [Pseudoxanthomonas sangjuensis]KAF1715061.1 carboxymethylenebutenolidase [Pseudoxanthomonas sangjuensis]